MKIAEFEYHAPQTLEEACRMLASYGRRACVLAGGTDVVVDMKNEAVSYEHLVSLKNLRLKGISFDRKSGLAIGALATHAEIASNALILKHYPEIAEAVLTLASPQVRNLGTIGGNICSAVPSADLPPLLMAMNASIRLVGPAGERTLLLADFFTGPRRTVIKTGEILTHVFVPAKPDGAGGCYVKFALRDATALAVVGVAAAVLLREGRCAAARIVLGAVSPTPVVALNASKSLVGRVIDDAAAGEAGRIAKDECRPISDVRGSADFRRSLVETLTRRAVLAAAQRAALKRTPQR
jgi:carbon-monoxide dehydrogenase medium subunit